MYKTLDGELTCAACTVNQCGDESLEGVEWVDGGECYLCARETPEQWTGLGNYVYTADDGSRVNLGVLDRPIDLQASLEALGAWTGTVALVHCPACHDDPAGCGECPQCPDCGDPMRDHSAAYCAEHGQV